MKAMTFVAASASSSPLARVPHWPNSGVGHGRIDLRVEIAQSPGDKAVGYPRPRARSPLEYRHGSHRAVERRSISVPTAVPSTCDRTLHVVSVEWPWVGATRYPPTKVRGNAGKAPREIDTGGTGRLGLAPNRPALHGPGGAPGADRCRVRGPAQDGTPFAFLWRPSCTRATSNGPRTGPPALSAVPEDQMRDLGPEPVAPAGVATTMWPTVGGIPHGLAPLSEPGHSHIACPRRSLVSHREGRRR